MQLLIQNENRPAFSPYTQMPSVTPPTYDYQHGSSVTSQATFPTCSNFPQVTFFNTKCLQRGKMIWKIKGETQVALKVTGHIDLVSHIDWSY